MATWLAVTAAFAGVPAMAQPATPVPAAQGVGRLRVVAVLAGPESINDTAARYGVNGTDQGHTLEHKGVLHMVFGDSFGRARSNWRSSVLAVFSDDDPSDDLTFDRMIEGSPGHAGELSVRWNARTMGVVNDVPGRGQVRHRRAHVRLPDRSVERGADRGDCKGVSKPGELVWSRVFVEDDALQMDIGRGRAVSLPPEETERRWQSTTPQWPIMHAVTYGVSRDQMMARHKANHIQVAYAPSAEAADRALAAKAAMMQALGVRVHLCGSDNGLVD